ncbi:glucose-6-phosphate dehydrogenase [Fundicoccus culcitae]|uniref:Glucose-6-phosphate 1-dehydrogenase n=1 Tax=Fundicoccus culcitae TaxID=2969821 RepID=A0ABY5P7R4_9LACT|nr:glucose-6-phosphate dehydrogenase [Fundicoccus culcitae]UUX34589.1 glucose-6-phosphate dehydrogenase [Fundicoccus culcitae]
MENNRLLITLFGSTGDLASRKLYPAIYRLYKYGHISKHFALVGTGRSQWNDEKLRAVVLDSIENEIDEKEHAEEFVSHFYYLIHDVNKKNDYSKLKHLADELDQKYTIEGNRIYYISLAPRLFPIITGNLKDQNVLTTNGFNRLIIEKPFGHDQASARELQDQLEESFEEDQIYRIDHYLGKYIVQNIQALRFNNPVFANIWNNQHIEQIQITLNEEVGVEDRAEYYDTSGVLRDMIQNHMLQLVSLLTMNKPENFNSKEIHQNKIDLLSHIHQYQDGQELKDNTVFGQYGSDDNQTVTAYRDEKGIAEDSMTPTYFAAKLTIDLEQWQGVPIYIRSGKRMANKATNIYVTFKDDTCDWMNHLLIEIAPRQGYQLYINHKNKAYASHLESVPLSYYLNEEEERKLPGDYERLIFECILGKRENFAHYDEVEASWNFIDHIFEVAENIQPPTFPNYVSYSQGPKEADDLLKKDGHHWLSD